jgi:hypothetical protein
MLAVAFGIVLTGARAGAATARVAVAPVRAATGLPLVGDRIGALAEQLDRDGRAAITDGRRMLEDVAVRVLSAPEVEHVAVQVIDAVDVDRIVDAILSDPRTERAIVRIMESRLADELTDRVIESPELQRIVEHVAASAEVRAAVTYQTQGLADEVVSEVRRRSENADDAVERRVRGWLHRPRPATP